MNKSSKNSSSNPEEKIILGICPARGGSKGLPGKHKEKLRGNMPMIAHTIKSARESNLLTDFLVTTEDKELQDITKNYRAKVVERPPELAGDNTPVSDVIKHLLNQLELNGERPDVLVLLQATSPLRTGKDIDGAIQKFSNEDCDSLVSVTDSRTPPYWHFAVEDGFLSPLLSDEDFEKHRQDFSNTVQLNGAIYITSTDTFLDNNGFFTEKTIPYKMPPERSVDVDDELDFLLAEALLQRKEEEDTNDPETERD